MLGSALGVSLCMWAADALLLAGTKSEAEQAWNRAVALLDKRPWLELFGVSPLYTWMPVVSVMGDHVGRFEAATDAPRRAFRQTLTCQTPSGGLCSVYYRAPNLGETALGAILAKAVLRQSWATPAERIQAQDLLSGAQRWLRGRRAIGRLYDDDDHDLFTAKLPFSAPVVNRALVLAALA